MTPRIVTCLLLWVAFAVECKAISPDTLLDGVISSPGGFDQMCRMPKPIDPAVPIPIYHWILERQVFPISKDYEMLRARRNEIIPILEKRFQAMDPSIPAPEPGPMVFGNKERPTLSGISPHQPSSLLFKICVALDAVETLPELLRLEQELHVLILKAEKDLTSPPPSIADDGILILPKAKSTQRERKMARARVLQREILSLVLQILRRQRYQPVLDSALEAQYAAEVRRSNHANEQVEVTTAAEAEAKRIPFDPILNLPRNFAVWVDVPFTLQLRTQIRAWAEKFREEVPPEKWSLHPELP